MLRAEDKRSLRVEDIDLISKVNRLIDLHIALDAVRDYGRERAIGKNLTHTLQEIDGRRKYVPNDPLVEPMWQSMRVAKYDTLPSTNISDIVESVLVRISDESELSLVTNVASANIFDKDFERYIQNDFAEISKKGLTTFQMEAIGLARINKSLSELEQELVMGAKIEIGLAKSIGIALPNQVQSQIGNISPLKTKTTQVE